MNLKPLKHKEIPNLRETLLKEQGGICPICDKEIIKPVLDHHHTKGSVKGTGRIRQVICNGCNIFLGKLENNCVRFGISQEALPTVLRNIVVYLRAEQTNYIHPSEVPKKRKLTKKSYNKLKKAATCKVPKYTGNYTKALERLFTKFNIKPEFYK